MSCLQLLPGCRRRPACRRPVPCTVVSFPHLCLLFPLPGPTELPLRLLTGFEVVDEGSSVQPLTSLPQQPGLVLTGQLVRPQGSAAAAAEAGPSITTAPLVDWVVEQSTVPGQPPTIWAVSQHAWYRLLQPSARYAPLFVAAMQAAGAQVEVSTCAESRSAGAATLCRMAGTVLVMHDLLGPLAHLLPGRLAISNCRPGWQQVSAGQAQASAGRAAQQAADPSEPRCAPS